LDSDLYFFSSPQSLLDEMGNDSVLITPHRYTRKYDQSATSGIYCVQFVTFKNDKHGLTVLNWWRSLCLDWCYDRIEDGRFGDQKYLDDWPVRFEGIHILQHLGGGVAPWNMQQYSFYQDSDKVMGRVLASNEKFEVVFFHFHSLMFVRPYYFSPRPRYIRNKSVAKFIFNPYVKKIKQLRIKYSQLKGTEHYLTGWKLIKYLAEIFIRRGFK
jgi:hypothetical protein